MTEVKYYRVFRRRLISEPMLMDQLFALDGQYTVQQMAALVGLAPSDSDPGKLYALCKEYQVPFRSTATAEIEAPRQTSGEQREAAKRVASAAACRLAEIAQARTAAATAPRYKRGPLVW